MRRRLAGPDAVRGLAVAGMLIVNHPIRFGEQFAALRHAAWHGLLPADFVFPFFVFMVGVSVALATRSAGSPPKPARILIRAGLLFCIGLAFNLAAFSTWEQLRLPGVLQRIALVYGGVALLARLRNGPVAWIAGLLLLLPSLVHLFGIPGIASAGWEVGQNPAGRLDNLILGTHVWRHSPDGDPEGILSTCGAVSTALLGLLAGRLHEASGEEKRSAIAMVCILIGLGAVLTPWIPVNKHLWTATFVLLTGGMAWGLLLLSVRLDRGGGRAPWSAALMALGRRALLVYVSAGVLERALRLLPAGGGTLHTLLTTPFRDLFPGGPEWGSLLWSSAWLLLWTLAALLLSRTPSGVTKQAG